MQEFVSLKVPEAPIKYENKNIRILLQTGNGTTIILYSVSTNRSRLSYSVMKDIEISKRTIFCVSDEFFTFFFFLPKKIFLRLYGI